MCGRHCDSRLTELGREQALVAAGILGRTSLVGSICVSPQQRAQETARIVNAVLSVSIVTIEELAEWDVGSWDHQPFASVRDEFLSSADPPGGETRPALVLRVKAALHRFEAVSQPALIVSHVVCGWRFSKFSDWKRTGPKMRFLTSCNGKRIDGG
jgi:broad specificity phosphatase PhoE